MRVQSVVTELDALKEAGIVENYAIGGAVGATFYLEPISTLDVDVFVALHIDPGKLILDPTPIFEFLSRRGHRMEGEFVVIGGWPVQFLAASPGLVAEAINDARNRCRRNADARVYSRTPCPVALQTGRSKDKIRLLAFMEHGELNFSRFEELITRFALEDRWADFRRSSPRGP